MNKKLTKLQDMQKILNQKVEAAKRAQRNLNREKRNLKKQLMQETLMDLAVMIQKTGYPIENQAVIVGMALRGKELLKKANRPEYPEAKNEVLGYMKKYDEFLAALKQKESKEESTVVNDDDGA